MLHIFEVTDKTGRKIRLTKERWAHIRRDHPDVQEDEIEQTISHPVKILDKERNKAFYYSYFKEKSFAAKYLRAIVKYLNGEGFVITAYFVKQMS